MGRKHNVKNALAQSFTELMQEEPFEKITIKMITDRAGVIRPTFYNHFFDKYELLEWICYRDVFAEVTALIDRGLYKEAVAEVFINVEENREFFIKAAKVEGQNGFKEIFTRLSANLFEYVIEESELADAADNKILTPREIAKYYGQSLTYIIETWLTKGSSVHAEQMTKIYYILATCTMEDLLAKGKDAIKDKGILNI